MNVPADPPTPLGPPLAPSPPLAAPDCETWAEHYVTSTTLSEKLAPPPLPARFASASRARRIAAPGRPPEFTLLGKTKRSLRREQLHQPRWRAHLLHTFLHHELQAAELMAWAVLAFPDAPQTFRRGLLRLCTDEIRHMQLYRGQIERLGFAVGDFPVRDWFWQRVATCTTPAQFVALLGLGLEGGNLDHAARYVEWFTAAGDHEAAAVQEQVGREEIAHVRFAAVWFRRFAGELTFARWAAALPPPLSPRLLRGLPLARAARLQAGQSPEFLDALAAT